MLCFSGFIDFLSQWARFSPNLVLLKKNLHFSIFDWLETSLVNCSWPDQLKISCNWFSAVFKRFYWHIAWSTKDEGRATSILGSEIRQLLPQRPQFAKWSWNSQAKKFGPTEKGSEGHKREDTQEKKTWSKKRICFWSELLLAENHRYFHETRFKKIWLC